MLAKDRKIIYICAPQNDTAASIIYQKLLCALLLQDGHTPLAPQVLCGVLKHQHPKAPALEVGISLLRRSDEVWVFGKPCGNMQAEITEAQNLDIPILQCIVYGGRGMNNASAMRYKVVNYGC